MRRKGIEEIYEVEWTKKNGENIITINSPNRRLNKDGEHIGSFAVIKDIAELKRVKTALSQREKELIYRAELDTLLAEISTKTINLDITNMDQEIVLILQKICDFFNFDSAVIIKYQEDLRYANESLFSKTHEYIRGHNPNRDKMYAEHNFKIQEGVLPWYLNMIRTLEPFQIADSNNLPPEASDLKEALDKFGSRSIHYFPLVIKEKLSGMLAFQSTLPLELEDFQTKKIKIVSDIIQSILERSLD